MPTLLWDPTVTEINHNYDDVITGDYDVNLDGWEEFEIETTDGLKDSPFSVDDWKIIVPRMENRPARLISCELEVGNGASGIARTLHATGVAYSPDVDHYHSRSTAFCHVEEDGSVNGEIIFQKMNLSKLIHARKFSKGLKTIYAAIKNGQSSLDMRCGFHVHIGVSFDGRNSCYTMDAIENLYFLTNYLEDTLFRLSSANWPCHRTEKAEENYAGRSPKGLKSKLSIGMRMERERGAVNLSPFLYERGQCHCGAFSFGTWGECTCKFDKGTIEFRVFNGTANPKKIHAYIALSQALVAYAETHKITEEEFPQLGWTQDTKTINLEQNASRLNFIFKQLPLTIDELKDVFYCVERSSLNKVSENDYL